MNNGLQHGALSARRMLTRRWPAPARHSRPPKAQEAPRPPSVRSKEEPPTAGLYGETSVLKALYGPDRHLCAWNGPQGRP